MCHGQGEQRDRKGQGGFAKAVPAVFLPSPLLTLGGCPLTLGHGSLRMMLKQEGISRPLRKQPWGVSQLCHLEQGCDDGQVLGSFMAAPGHPYL